MSNEQKIRARLLVYLNQAHTHAPFAKIAAHFPLAYMNKKLVKLPYTPWMLLEHIRIAQHDMVDFIKNPKYKNLVWPKDYWPSPKQKATQKMWLASVTEYERDLKILKTIIKNPKNDLLTPIKWGTGQTIFQEVLQIIDHASYHIGEFVVLQRMMGIWKK